MRKTSQDGGDSTSITSGIENEIKKTGAIIKTKRNSLKRKVQNFSHESDDAVIEPLLQKDKEKTDTTKQSAKYNLLSKTKTEPISEKESDKEKLIQDEKAQKLALSNTSNVSDEAVSTPNGKEYPMCKITSQYGPLHNHMNTNVFSSHDGLKGFVAPKSHILVEIDASKHVGYSPSPLIFTTAKIHTDGKTKHMEPVQVTPMPILSTIEVSVARGGSNTVETSGQVSSNISAVYPSISHNMLISSANIIESDQEPSFRMQSNKIVETKSQVSTDKMDISSNLLDKTKLSQSVLCPISVKDNGRAKDKEDKYQSKIINSSSNDKSDTQQHLGRKSELNKNDKLDALDSQRSKASENVSSLDKSTKDVKDPTNATFNNKQVQRQNFELDKDDSIVKPSTSSNLCFDSKDLQKSSEYQKISTIYKSNLCDKNKSPNFPIDSITTTLTSAGAIDSKTFATTFDSVGNNQKPAFETNITTISKTPSSGVTITAASESSTAINASAPVNKTSAPISINTALNKMSTTTTTASNKSSANILSQNKANLYAPVSKANSSAIVSKSTNSMSTSVTANKTISTPITTNPNKTSNSVLATTTVNKVSILPITTAMDKKISGSITMTTASNKVSVSNISTTTSNMTPVSVPVTAVLNKVSASTVTSAIDKNISTSITMTTAPNKVSVQTISTTTSNKILASVPATSNKVSAQTVTTSTDNNISASITKSMASNKTSALSTSTAGGNKTSPTPDSKKSTLPSAVIPIAKPTVQNKLSSTKPLHTGKYAGNGSSIENRKGLITDAITKPQVTAFNTNPSSSTVTTISAKVAKPSNSTTTSQSQPPLFKSPIVTTAKPETIKIIPQAKPIEITMKSSRSNEKVTSKNNSTSINSTISATTNIPSTVTASSGSSSISVVSNKQTDSKSTDLTKDSKSSKA